MNRGWHILRVGDTLTLARHMPVRFDVVAQTTLPACHPLRLAHQIRQDIWRALQSLRGFSPVIEVRVQEEAAHIRAGGRVFGAEPNAVPPVTVSRLREVLDAPANRARWVRYAGEVQ